jgi:hypothetical protein
MSSSAASRKHDTGKRVYRRKDPERRRAERKWHDPAMRRENHALRPGQGLLHGRSDGRTGEREER